MRVLVVALGLMFSVLPVFGYLAFDYSMSNRAARAMGEVPVSFTDYLGGWVGLAQATPAAADAPGAPLPEGLAAMLPLPPEGWTARPAAPGDAALLKGKASRKDAARITEILTDGKGRGVEAARMAYVPADGRGVVIFELTRFPDAIFTSFAGMGIRMELQMATMEWSDQPFMTVRGLTVAEARLPRDVPARAFAADVAGQVQLRVAASRRFADMDLLPLFQTLHVPAMNAAVARPVRGMGQVPVIVVASAMDDQGLAALRAEQEAAAADSAETAAREAAEAEEQAAAESAAPAPEEAAAAEETDSIPIRRGTEKDRKTGINALGGACRIENGRKVCDSAD